MKKIIIGEWTLFVDPEKTSKMLKKIKSGAETCTCGYCKNFIANRPNFFPKEFLEILTILGIDPNKDVGGVEIYKMKNDLHLYKFYYYFIGQIINNPKKYHQISDSFSYIIDDQTLYRLHEFPKNIIRIEAMVQLPWIIKN